MAKVTSKRTKDQESDEKVNTKLKTGVDTIEVWYGVEILHCGLTGIWYRYGIMKVQAREVVNSCI